MDNELKEILENISNRLELIEFKLDRNGEKIDNVDLRLRMTESNIRKDLKKLHDESDTVIEVLKQSELLPR